MAAGPIPLPGCLGIAPSFGLFERLGKANAIALGVENAEIANGPGMADGIALNIRAFYEPGGGGNWRQFWISARPPKRLIRREEPP
jgi:hypothetical protein